MNWYDAIAKGYDELRGDEQRQKFAVFDDYVHEDMRVLDVGFGTGLSDEYFDAEIVGLEPSQGMLNEYEGNAKTYNALAEDIDELFEPNSFDAVLCVSTAHHFEDEDVAFRNIQRVLNRESYLFLSAFTVDIDRLVPYFKGFAEVKRASIHRDEAIVYKTLE